VSRLLGIDLGERRVGIALADGDGAPARPLTTLRRARRLDGDVAAIAVLVRTHEVGELVVGLPLEASGDEGPQASLTRTWAEGVAADLDLPLLFRDERLTSYLAEDRLGPMPRGRSGGPPTKAQRDAYRARVDREAAAIILQDELDARAGMASSRVRPSDPSESRS
jgi:putative holliday junction resolvase